MDPCEVTRKIYENYLRNRDLDSRKLYFVSYLIDKLNQRIRCVLKIIF